MLTRANSFNNPSSSNSSSSPMSFAPSSPFNFPSYFSAMTLSSPTSSSPPPPFLPSTPPLPRMSPFNPAAGVHPSVSSPIPSPIPSPSPSYSSSSLAPAYGIPPPVGYPPELYPHSPPPNLYLSSEVDKTTATTSPIPINKSQEMIKPLPYPPQQLLYTHSSTPPKNSPNHQYGFFSSNNPPYIPPKNMMTYDMDIPAPSHHTNIPKNYNEENTMDYM